MVRKVVISDEESDNDFGSGSDAPEMVTKD